MRVRAPSGLPEIATRAGRPLGTIKSRLRLAFDKLRDVLQDHDL